MALMLPLLAFVFASLLVAAVGMRLCRRPRQRHRPPSGGGHRRVPDRRCETQVRGRERAIRKFGSARWPRLAEGDGQGAAAARPGGLSRRRGAAAVLRHPDGDCDRRIRADGDAAADPPERDVRHWGVPPGLSAAGHRAGRKAKKRQQKIQLGAGRRARPDGRERRGRAGPRSGDPFAWARSCRLPIPTCRTSCGW